MKHVNFKVWTDEEMVVVLPMWCNFEPFECGTESHYASWVKFVSVMTLKEYQVREDWSKLRKTHHPHKRDYLNAENLLNEYHGENMFDTYDWDMELGYTLIKKMNELKRIAYEAVMQKRDIRLVMKFAEEYLLTVDEEAWFFKCYNDAVLEEESYVYDLGWNAGYQYKCNK